MTIPNLRQDAVLVPDSGTMNGGGAAVADAPPYFVQGPVDGHPANADLVFTFSEAIQAGSGNVIVRSWDGSFTTSFSITDGAVRISGSTLSLHLPQRLAYATSYQVWFDQEAIEDLAGQTLQYSASTVFQSGLSPVAVNLVGTAGNDTLHGSELGDTLSGGAGQDFIHGHGGNDLIHGGDETDPSYGDMIDGGDGNDTIYGDKGDDRLTGGNGDDILYGGDGNDVLDGGNGNDLLEGGAGNDILYSFGYDTGRDTLRGGDGDDDLSGQHEGVLDGGAGNDTLTGYDGIEYLGGSGDDSITVNVDSTTKLASRIDGGAGNDRIQLNLYSATDAQLSVSGGTGSDTFVLTGMPAGWNKDARVDIKDFTPGTGGDVIDLLSLLPYDAVGNPFASGVVRLVADGADTLLQVRSSISPSVYTTALHLANVKPALLTSANFVGGIDPGGSNKGVALTGTTQGDTLTGFLLDDVLHGLDGNDTLDGKAGNDTIDGGAGDDRLVGGAGNDSLIGGLGNDTLSDDQGDNRLLGGEGNDILTSTSNGANLLEGGTGNDDLQGGNGNDTLSGGDGDDIIRISNTYNGQTHTVEVLGGEGRDLIVFDNLSRTTVTASGGNGADTFQFSSNNFFSGPYTLTIADFDAAGGDKLDLLALLPADLGANPFGTAGFLKAEQSGSDVKLYFDSDGAARTTYGYTLIATLANVSLSSLVPSAFVGGLDIGGGNKGLQLEGTAGADTLAGGWLDDTISGGDGADVITGGPGNDVLWGGDESDPEHGDTLAGGRGDDTLEGGAGNDSLMGEQGNDVLRGGSGNDMLQGGDGNDSLYGGDGNDVLNDSSGANLFDGGDGNDIIYARNSYYGLRGNATIDGGAGDDTITAGSGNDIVRGGSGNDTIQVNLGGTPGYHITVDGGDGDDIFVVSRDYSTQSSTVEITGGAGRDTYGWTSYAPAADVLTITDFTAGAGGDRLDLSSVQHSEPWTRNPFATGFVRLVASGADTLLQFDPDGTGTEQGFGTIAVLKGVAPDRLTGDNFVAGIRPDGSQAGMDVQGGSGNDTLYGGFLDDTIHGGAGDDRIESSGGNDWLYGDDGNDRLSSQSGDAHLYGGAGNDVLSVYFGDNVMDGGDGKDILSVYGNGNNTLLGGRGDDTLEGGGGNDTLEGGEGDDLLYGKGGDNLLSGGSGLDTALYGDSADAITVTHDAAGWHVTGLNITGTLQFHDTLRDVERLSFADQTLALDTDGTAGQAYRIYRAAFDRAPDLDGLGFWIGMMDKGISLHDVAAGFVQSEEFATLYGSAPTNAEIVTRLYQNILHRAPEQEGYAFWLGVLDNKLADLPAVLAAISESAENQASVATLIANGIAYAPYFG